MAGPSSGARKVEVGVDGVRRDVELVGMGRPCGLGTSQAEGVRGKGRECQRACAGAGMTREAGTAAVAGAGV
ncbi:hypothetical protein GCM10010336_61740 [Streptomyces goshikiensis]|nr:hypothetical protein GCM10010336_61740 [Streptomyces goshikiensis]